MIPRTVALFPFWFALLGALGEVAVRYVVWTRDTVPHLSPDFPWMAPLALLTCVLAVSWPLLFVPAVGRSNAAVQLFLFIAAAQVSINFLLLIPGLAHYAAALLAVGIAVQVSRWVSTHQAATERVVGRTVAPLTAATLVAVGAATYAVRPRLADPSGTPAAGAPNLIVITLDTVGAGHLSLHGYPRDTVSNISAFGARGVVFDEAYSTAPWTLPSHASMFTGRWPHELTANYDVPLDRAYPTLAEVLSARGYATAGFVSNLQYCGRGSGLARGFAHYEDFPRTVGSVVTSSTLLKTVMNNFRLRRLVGNDEHLDRVDASEINTRVTRWLAGQTKRPFMIFVNYFDAHEPYLPPPPFDRRFGPGRRNGRHSPIHHWLWNPAFNHRALSRAEREEEVDAYDGAIAEVDARVGELLASLEASGRLSNTIVVITADHGEEFGEHGVYDHGYSLYRAGVHVPLMVVAPGRVPGGLRVKKPVSLRDLAATLADLVDPVAPAPFPGTSLRGLWRNDTTAPSVSPILSEVKPPGGQPEWFPVSKGDMQSLVVDGLRYIRNGDGREELYRVADDPMERADLAAKPESRSLLEAARAQLAAISNSRSRD